MKIEKTDNGWTIEPHTAAEFRPPKKGIYE